tara:strand:- start:121 stop:372 length:252 start_codon:yes stop_codon:yes gene_type:complete
MEDLLQQMTPEIYGDLKTAIELGKWSDGSKLEQEQLENCMQLLILYEARALPEEFRTSNRLNSCKSELSETEVLDIRNTPDKS